MSRQKAEGRKQKAESSRQKAEGRKRKAEIKTAEGDLIDDLYDEESWIYQSRLS